MSYNNNYNTRNSGRYPSMRFTSGGELAPGGAVGYGRGNRGHNNGMNNQYRQDHRQQQQPQQQQQQPQPQQQPQQQQSQPQQQPPQSQHQPPQSQQQQPQQQPPQSQQQQPQSRPTSSPPLPPPPPPQPQTREEPALMSESTDVEMTSVASEPAKDAPDKSKPHWMKSKVNGVKKIKNKDRRRRQNNNLRRLLAPKNALMVLNEMLPVERETAQFKVEPTTAQSYFDVVNKPTFHAELVVDGTYYKGYGENKISARNHAAEQAVRDIMIKRMDKLHTVEGSASSAILSAEEDDDALPMIQLASYALYKLFSEWESEGHKVPSFKPSAPPSASETASEASAPAAPRAKPPRALPAGAADMHPCMLLTYMRPHLDYRELAVDGDRPQNMFFTMGIDVDGSTYIGKGTNKREARKQAARAACAALFGVTFSDAAAAGAGALQSIKADCE